MDLVISIILLIFLLFISFVYDYGLFRLTERYCCKKAHGDCSKCKAWSCYKYNLEFQKRKSGDK